jgi:hypothetical protein
MIAFTAKLRIIEVTGWTLKWRVGSAWLQKGRLTLKGNEDGSDERRPREDQTSGTVKELWTALPGRVSRSSGKSRSSHIDSAGWSSLSTIGSRNNIPTCRVPGWSGPGRRDIHKGASGGRDGRELSVYAQLDGLRRGGVRVAECTAFSKTKRGTRYLIGKASTEKKLLIPTAVGPPRIHLYRQSRMHSETNTRVRILVRNR